MGHFFKILSDRPQVIKSENFGNAHKEDDLQQWVDICPEIINEGKPLLSLGREITTQYGHYIDNMCIDAMGTVVIAELKRGRTVRGVTSQLLDYAIYAKGLSHAALDKLAIKKHGKTMGDAFRDLFGFDFPVAHNVEHRLIILAEDFDARTIEHCQYLQEHGTPVACIKFSLYGRNNEKTLQTETVLGEIPKQENIAQSTTVPLHRFKLLADEIEKRTLKLSNNSNDLLSFNKAKMSLNLAPQWWPNTNWSRAFFVQQSSDATMVTVGFWYHIIMYENLDEVIHDALVNLNFTKPVTWQNTPKYKSLITYHGALPETETGTAVDAIWDALLELIENMRPVVDKYFSDTEIEGDKS